MKKILNCRRSSLALIGMLLLFGLGYFKAVDVAGAISAITMAVAVSNAYEKVKSVPKE